MDFLIENENNFVKHYRTCWNTQQRQIVINEAIKVIGKDRVIALLKQYYGGYIPADLRVKG